MGYPMPETDSYLDTQSIFDLIGKHADLSLIFQTISEWLEAIIPDSMVSVMSYSEIDKTLSLVSGEKHFSDIYKNAVKHLEIGPEVGACGTAAFHRKLVICENLLNDPKWQTCQALLLQENLQACWSTPIINAVGTLYGTFATYYRSPKRPTSTHIKLIRHAASLIALSMDLYVERQQRLTLDDKYRSFFSYHPDAIFEHNVEGIIIDSNHASENITEFHSEKIIGVHFLEFINPEFQSVAQNAFQEALNGNSQHLEVKSRKASNRVYWLDLTFLPIKQNQQVVGVFAITRDITERHETEEMLRVLKRGMDANPHGVLLTHSGGDQELQYVNPAFEQITGYTNDEVVGKNCRFLQGPDTNPETILEIRKAVQEKQEIKTVVKNYRKDGSWFWNKLILGPVFDEQNVCTHFIGIQQDITQQQINTEYIARQQTHDMLTGLMNYTSFEKYLNLAFYTQQESQGAVIVMYIELDGFQKLNHSLGYLVGDQLLIAVADRLRDIFGESDIVARFSADGFGVLLRDFKDLKQVIVITEEILKSLSIPFEINGHNIHISASIGIADNDPQIEKSSEFLYHAIHAMNAAKKEGGNTWHWYSFNATSTPRIDYVLMRHEIMVALKKKQFQLVYQPLIDVHSGELKSVETLIRWQHPQKGLISPLEFIPFAEETGQIVAIGQWVLEQACLDIVEWNKKHDHRLCVAVNISPLQFKRTGFLCDLQDTLKKTQLLPELLKIEMTEGMLMESEDYSLRILESIRELGIKVSVDDFGTGYSSLSYLRTLPADEIKLDRSFINHLPDNTKDVAIVSAIIMMAHQLGLEVVAEGVETYAQAQFLKEHQCDYFQGYYFARPMPIEQLKTHY